MCLTIFTQAFQVLHTHSSVIPSYHAPHAGPNHWRVCPSQVHLLPWEGEYEWCVLCPGLFCTWYACNCATVPGSQAIVLWSGRENDPGCVWAVCSNGLLPLCKIARIVRLSTWIQLLFNCTQMHSAICMIPCLHDDCILWHVLLLVIFTISHFIFTAIMYWTYTVIAVWTVHSI